MKIKGKKCLILGGTGLVGFEISRKILEEEVDQLILSSLGTNEDLVNYKRIKTEFPDANIKYEKGDIFDYASKTFKKENNFLYKLICQNQPDVVIDCVTTAGFLSYKFSVKDDLISLLIKHIMLLYTALKKDANKKEFKRGAQIYVKVGTTGTGGMGLNIPYTHGEDKPSLNLLKKASVGWINTGLLFLLSRTPDAPIIKEIKPATSIAWGRVDFGPVLRKGVQISLTDSEKPQKIEKVRFKASEGTDTGEKLNSVYITSGENGYFSLQEFTALTSPGQMEFVLAEEIAKHVIYELKGQPTGHDVISSLNSSVLGSSFSAGVERGRIIKKMKEMELANDARSVAFEILGPPRLSKLLYEAFLLRSCIGLSALVRRRADEVSKELEEQLLTDANLRVQILSIGIPVLLSKGRLLKSVSVKVPQSNLRNFSKKDIESWSSQGWVDIREENIKKWQKRINAMRSSGVNEFEEGSMAAWIFANEDLGERKF